MYICLMILIVGWFAYWSAESGASLPWSKSWQIGLLDRLPELIIALTVGLVASWGWGKIFDISALYIILGFFAFVAIAFAGKESATWGYLNWTGHVKDKNDDGIIDDRDGRDSTLSGINNFIAGLFGYRLGSEGYSWIWAGVKGFIMTLPIIPTGAIFHPLGHELGSHAQGRLNGDSNMWKEMAGGGIGFGIPVVLFVLFVDLVV